MEEPAVREELAKLPEDVAHLRQLIDARLAHDEKNRSGNTTPTMCTESEVPPDFRLAVLPTPFLSFFAEYAVTAQLTANISRSSSGGSVTSDADFDAALLAGLGNGGKVGVVVYFGWEGQKK